MPRRLSSITNDIISTTLSSSNEDSVQTMTNLVDDDDDYDDVAAPAASCRLAISDNATAMGTHNTFCMSFCEKSISCLDFNVNRQESVSCLDFNPSSNNSDEGPQ